MSKFKAGDLALIIGSKSHNSPNHGRSVELIQFLQPDEKFECPDGKIRRNGSGISAWLVSADGLLARRADQDIWVDIGGACIVHERYLMPLRGDFQPEQQKVKEVEA